MESALHLALRLGGATEDFVGDGGQLLPLDFFDSDDIAFPLHNSDDFSNSLNTPAASQDPPSRFPGGAIAKLETEGHVFTRLHEHGHRLRNVANAVIAVNRLSSAAKRTKSERSMSRVSSASSTSSFQSNFAADLQSPGRVFALLGMPSRDAETPGVRPLHLNLNLIYILSSSDVWQARCMRGWSAPGALRPTSATMAASSRPSRATARCRKQR